MGVLAYCIAVKVIKRGGENTFLRQQDSHSVVRSDFYDNPKGVAKKTVVIRTGNK